LGRGSESSGTGWGGKAPWLIVEVVRGDVSWLEVVPVAELPLLPPGAQTAAVSAAAAAPVGAAATPHASAPLMRLPAATAPVAAAAVAAAMNAGKKRDQTGVCGNTG